MENEIDMNFFIALREICEIYNWKTCITDKDNMIILLKNTATEKRGQND